MVTKLRLLLIDSFKCSVLAKIHMVTKLQIRPKLSSSCSVLAKIHMVTKHAFT